MTSLFWRLEERAALTHLALTGISTHSASMSIHVSIYYLMYIILLNFSATRLPHLDLNSRCIILKFKSAMLKS